ncbi:uncharacterized protein ACNLHF_002588 [Anomaloglossus baeobatrachus]
MIPVYRQQDEQKRIREDAQPSTMKNLVAFLCMIAVFIVPIFSDKCKSCDSDQLPCKETDIECDSRGCMTSFSTIHAKGRVYHKLHKGCATDPVCEIRESNTNFCPDFQKSELCCFKNVCNNSGIIEIKKRKSEVDTYVVKIPLKISELKVFTKIQLTHYIKMPRKMVK